MFWKIPFPRTTAVCRTSLFWICSFWIFNLVRQIRQIRPKSQMFLNPHSSQDHIPSPILDETLAKQLVFPHVFPNDSRFWMSHHFRKGLGGATASREAASANGDTQSYAAGYLEGALTHTRRIGAVIGAGCCFGVIQKTKGGRKNCSSLDLEVFLQKIEDQRLLENLTYRPRITQHLQNMCLGRRFRKN